MPVWTIWYVEAFPPLVALSLILAWRWGSSAALVTALIYLAGTNLQKAVTDSAGVRFVHFEPIVAMVDLAVLFGLVVLAHRCSKTWLTCSAALQFLGCLGHLAKLFQPSMPALVYEILMGSTGYPLLILLWIGIFSPRTERTPAE